MRPPFLIQILKVWHCRSIDGTSYLVADFNLVCVGPDGTTNSEWLLYSIVAGVFFCIYSLGVPFFYYYLLASNAAALYDEDHPDHDAVWAKFSFLYESYRPDIFYWEVC